MAEPSETTQVTGGPSRVETDELLAAVRTLSAQVGDLRAELQALRTHASPLPEAELHGWQERSRAFEENPAWVRSIDLPAPRRPAVPRLLLEIAFLVAVAVLCAVAELDAPVIAALMGISWALVAGFEWATATSARRREEAAYRSGFTTGSHDEGVSWLEPGDDGSGFEGPEVAAKTGAKLPPPE